MWCVLWEVQGGIAASVDIVLLQPAVIAVWFYTLQCPSPPVWHGVSAGSRSCCIVWI